MYSTEKKALIGGTIMIMIVLGALFGRFYLAEHKKQRAQEEIATLQQEIDEQKIDFPTISTQELDTILKDETSDLRIIDIRTKHSYDTKHLPDTMNIPQDRLTLRDVFLPAEQLIVLIGEETPLDEPIFKEILDAGQKKRVVLLEGGFEAWDTQTGRTISFGDPNSFIDHAKVTPISKAALQDKLLQEPDLYTLIDVRAEKEFAKEHINGAINLPLPRIEEKADGAVPVGKIIIVYGEDELEGFQAGVRLHDLGYLAVQMLQGGYTNWISAAAESNEPQEQQDPPSAVEEAFSTQDTPSVSPPSQENQ